ncbi:hypothetical protein [Lentzea atacamensis]|uniref:hypothetical protein n=1 Tax=Lentzea atacamensis TaxID=531938 RepID=UPI0011BD6CA5|nr:hypothetical protein [Lentzea atacamensis]
MVDVVAFGMGSMGLLAVGRMICQIGKFAIKGVAVDEYVVKHVSGPISEPAVAAAEATKAINEMVRQGWHFVSLAPAAYGTYVTFRR